MKAGRSVGWKLLIAFSVLGAATGYLASLRVPDLYRADALILVIPQRVPESYVRSTVTTKLEDRMQAIANQILSRTRLERIIQDFNLFASERGSGGIMEDIIDRMRDNITVKVERGDAFRVSYVGHEPFTVQKVTDRLASLFIDESLRDREVLAEGTSQFLEAQLQDTKRQLVKLEPVLRSARQRNDPEAEVLALEYEVLQAFYKDLLKKRQESGIAANLERRQIGEQFKLLDSARRPERPFSPNRVAYAGYGALAGLGVGLALFFGLPKRSVRQAETLQPQEV